MAKLYEDTQPLLDRRIILLTGAVDETMYREFSWCLASLRADDPHKPCQLRITSYGGSIDISMAMVDLIRMDGNCWGVVLGKAASSAANIWLACKQRYIGDHAVIGMHQALFDDRTNLTAQDLKYMAVELQRRNVEVANLFAAAANVPIDYWMNSILNATSELNTYDAQDMVRMGIAKPFATLSEDLYSGRQIGNVSINVGSVDAGTEALDLFQSELMRRAGLAAVERIISDAVYRAEENDGSG